MRKWDKRKTNKKVYLDNELKQWPTFYFGTKVTKQKWKQTSEKQNIQQNTKKELTLIPQNILKWNNFHYKCDSIQDALSSCLCLKLVWWGWSTVDWSWSVLSSATASPRSSWESNCVASDCCCTRLSALCLLKHNQFIQADSDNLHYLKARSQWWKYDLCSNIQPPQ